jgi:hypothetical protein
MRFYRGRKASALTIQLVKGTVAQIDWSKFLPGETD